MCHKKRNGYHAGILNFLKRKKQHLAVVCVSVLLVGFVVFLLSANYYSQINLQKSALDKFRQQTEELSSALGYFCEERKLDLENLTKSRYLSVFFENKALGMSMEYGLRSSLDEVLAHFSELIKEKQVGPEEIYSRIAFINPDGSMLVDTVRAPSFESKETWRNYLNYQKREPEIICKNDAHSFRMLISTPFFFKQEYSGQVIAWVNSKSIHDSIIQTELSANQLVRIDTKQSTISWPEDSSFSGMLNFGIMQTNKPQRFDVSGIDVDRLNVIGLKIPVDGTPFSLVNILPSSNIVGSTSPGQLLFVMGTVALILLGGTTFILRMFTRNQLLHIHLDESKKREEEIKKRNLALKNEIIERKKVQEALGESEERLKTILKSVNAGVVIIDPETHEIIEANPAALNMVNAPTEEVLGHVCHRYICPAEKGQCPVTDHGKTVDSSERVLLNINGEHVPILKTVVKIKFSGRTHLLESFIDITQLKNVQRELEGAKDVAENASRAKSEFLANMSHELRTPLNHIIGFTELVVDKNLGDLNETQEEYLTDSLQSSRHLLSLINDILDLSKVEAGKLELEITDVMIREVLANSLTMLKEKALKHRIQIDSHLDGIPEIVMADERKLKQIIYNLLSNAVKFSPDGGNVNLKAQMLDVEKGKASSINSNGSSVIEISVSDTGIGLKGEDLIRIFNPFEQVESTASRNFQGTGLGLSLTKSLVELHGGKIWAESAGEGKGSTFRFTLPIKT